MSDDTEEWSWEIWTFLYDAIDLYQSVKGTLKVQGKSLTTILDKVHLIVNLYSFSPTSGPPGKPFLPHGQSFAPLPGRTTSKTPPLFFC